MAKDDENYSAYLTANLEKFKGKWIVLCDKRIIASGKDVIEIVSQTQMKYPDNNFLLARVSEEGAMVF
ncbi:MAG: hypothetical protein FVQ82_08085 [Planctomycetes bacterium]|nr:hypothetical protein [Planctomycetota bacterium]